MYKRQFAKALTRTTDLLAPLYKPLFVLYVLSTIIGLTVGSFTDADIKQVGRLVVYTSLAAMSIAAIAIAAHSIYVERTRRRETPNPQLRVTSQIMKMKFCSDGSVEFGEKLNVISTVSNLTKSREWNGWRGSGSYQITKTIGGSVRNPVEVDHAGMNFDFTFDAPLARGTSHEYGYTIRFENPDGFIKRFIQRASYYAPEESLTLEIEDDSSQPLIVRRLRKGDVFLSARVLNEPELICYRRYSWHIPDPQHGTIYEIHWEHA